MTTRSTKRLLVGSTAAMAALVVAAPLAWAAIPAEDNSITACYSTKNGDLRVVGSTSECGKNETALSWNQRGQTGATGMTGPRGEMGPRGEQGEQGLQGLQGPQGERGFRGEQGPIGPQGELGPQGFRGPQGETGLQGEVGPQGERGFRGVDGLDGERGAEGPVGPRGPAGLTRALFSSTPASDDREVPRSGLDVAQVTIPPGSWVIFSTFEAAFRTTDPDQTQGSGGCVVQNPLGGNDSGANLGAQLHRAGSDLVGFDKQETRYTLTVSEPWVVTLRCQRFGDVPMRLTGQQRLDAIEVSSASRTILSPPTS